MTNSTTTVKVLTNEEIEKIFEANGCYICILDDKSYKETYGMTYTANKWNSINFFCSYKRAYDYFVKNNWI